MHDAEIQSGSKPPCSRVDAEAVVRTLRQAGHVAYFAGGCVRDLVLGQQPKDWDVATDAPPKRVRQLFARTQAVGALFGVILVRQGQSVVEVATFRTESGYEDGRRPSHVQFATAQEDARRRDFTINGLFLDPLDNDRVIDFVGGVDDLRNRILRAIGQPEQRFAEDHLRLLRAVRFAARLGFEIEPATTAAIARDAPLLKRISPERIGEELRQMLRPPTRVAAWRMLWQFRLIDVIMRFLAGYSPASLVEGQSIFAATAPGESIPFGLALAAGVLDVRRGSTLSLPAASHPDIRPLLDRKSVQQAVRALRQSLKISNEESDELKETLEGLGPLLTDAEPRVATLRRFLARPTAPLSRQLLEALASVNLHRDRANWLRARLSQLERLPIAPPPLITGDDLTAAGLTPGPLFKRVLEAVYDAQLEGRVTTRENAMAMAIEMSR